MKIEGKKFILIFASCLMSSAVIFAKSMTLDIPDREIKIVENDVVDAEQWIRAAWAGKVNKCRERLIKTEIDLSVKEQKAIPAGEDAIVDQHFSRPQYKNRKERDR